MDDIVSSAMVECSHDDCKSSVPYHELMDHERGCPHAPCYCTEPGCGFVGPPAALLGHLTAQHSVSVHTVHYGKVHRLRMSGTRCLLHGVGDDSAFLLATGALGAATIMSAVCIRAAGSPLPRYSVKLWANGPPPPSNAAGSILLDIKAVTSSTRPGEVTVEKLPSFLMVPPAYLVGSGASKELTLDIRIDKI
jgi:E3 ubiquitin-protein ligase SIAH1